MSRSPRLRPTKGSTNRKTAERPLFDAATFLATAAVGRDISKYSKKDVIFAQGDEANAVFYIKKGKVKVAVISKQGKEAIVALLGADEFVGEGCLIGQFKCSHDHPSRDARALASCRFSRLLALEVMPTGRATQIDTDLRALIRRMSIENPLWGAPRIHGELLKLGFEVAQSSVAKYMVKRHGPPSQGWRTFLRNHAPNIAAMDLFVVPTIGFDQLYAFIIIRLDRRDLAWINVTTNPTAEWIARQLTEAFPWNEAPLYLIRDRDQIYGAIVTGRLRAMGIRDRPAAPASPWQNGFAERLIGSIRRECLDHFIVFGEAHLRRILQTYAGYYNFIRTHRSLDKDAPVSRSVQRTGSIRPQAILGGLHHHYVRV